MENLLVWFEIPAQDLLRAQRFYANVLNLSITFQPGDPPMGLLAHKDERPEGCLYQSATANPAGERTGDSGILCYFNVNGRLDDALVKVTQHGGDVIQPKQNIGVYGFRAIVKDTEGNIVALHSETG
jgi:predicted enzyme related to lactoylglutathione lyase